MTEHRYKMTEEIMRMILVRKGESPGGRLYCKKCGRRIRVGNRVITKNVSNAGRKQYHLDCYEKMVY